MKRTAISFVLAAAMAALSYGQNTLAGNLTVQQTVKLTGTASPAALAVDVNDWAPTGLSTATTLRVAASGASRTVTGLAGGTAGRVLTVVNVGAFSVVLASESSSSAAGNRMAFGSTDLTLAAGSAVTLWYDGTSTRWRPTGGAGTGGGTGTVDQVARDAAAAAQATADTKQDALANASTLGKITEAAGQPLWDGAAWPGGGGSGTVTTVSVVTANGVSGTVATPTTTPAITLNLGAITPSSVAATGTVTGSNLTGTNTGDQTDITGNAGTATKLATARTINGVAFDGTANITVAAVDQAARDAAATAQTTANEAETPAGAQAKANAARAGAEATAAAALAGHVAAADPHGDRAYAVQRANHTGTQAATTIVEDTTHRFVTDTEKSTWNAKVSFPGFGTTAGTAAEGNDARLSDARPASDVYAWAKAATKPTYTYSEVGADPAGAAAAITLSGLGGVPTTRTVNGHALSADVTVTAADLGATTLGQNLLTLANPSAVTFPRFNADNTVTALSATDFRTAIGAGTSSFNGSYASLSDVPSTFTPAAHNQPWSTITTTPTTLSGYGITDAFNGAYASLSGIPSTFTPAAHNQAWSTITTTPTTLSGYGITDAQPLDTELTSIAALTNATGVLTNNGSGGLSWAAAGGGSTGTVIFETDFISPAAGTTPGLAQILTNGATVVNFMPPTGNNPGVVTLSDSATANASAAYVTSNDAFLLEGGEEITVIASFKGVRLGQKARIGFLDTSTYAYPTDAVFFEWTANGSVQNLTGWSANTGGSGATDTSYTTTSETFYRLTVSLNSNASVATFTIHSMGGALLWTNTRSANIPTGPSRNTGAGVVAFETTTATGAEILHLDYMKCTINRSLGR